jgi:hypothetical protein
MSSSGLPSGRGCSVERMGARGRTARPPRASATREGCQNVDRPAQDPSPPPRPTHAPPRRLLLLLLQQQVDALSNERRGVPVSRVRGQLPYPVPRHLIQTEGDDSRLSRHSLSSFACGRDRRLNPIRASAVLFMDGSVGRARGERRQPDSERFRSIPRTEGAFVGTLGPSIGPRSSN